MRSRIPNDLSAIHKLNQKLNTRTVQNSKDTIFKSSANQSHGKSVERRLMHSSNPNNYRFHSPNVSFKSYDNPISFSQQPFSDMKRPDEKIRTKKYDKNDNVQSRRGRKERDRVVVAPSFAKDAMKKIRGGGKMLGDKKMRNKEKTGKSYRFQEQPNLDDLEFYNGAKDVPRVSDVSDSSGSSWTPTSNLYKRSSPKAKIQALLSPENTQDSSFKKKKLNLMKKNDRFSPQRMKEEVQGNQKNFNMTQKLRDIYKEAELMKDKSIKSSKKQMSGRNKSNLDTSNISESKSQNRQEERKENLSRTNNKKKLVRRKKSKELTPSAVSKSKSKSKSKPKGPQMNSYSKILEHQKNRLAESPSKTETSLLKARERSRRRRNIHGSNSRNVSVSQLEEEKRSRSGSIKKLIKDQHSYFDTRSILKKKSHTPTNIKSKGKFAPDFLAIKKKKIDLRNLSPGHDLNLFKHPQKITRKSKSIAKSTNELVNEISNNSQKISKNGSRKKFFKGGYAARAEEIALGRSATPRKYKDKQEKVKSFRSNSKSKQKMSKKIKQGSKHYREIHLKKNMNVNGPVEKKSFLHIHKKFNKSKKKLKTIKLKGNDTSSSGINNDTSVDKYRTLEPLERSDEDKYCDVMIESEATGRSNIPQSEDAKIKIKKLSKSESLEKLKAFNKKINDDRKKNKEELRSKSRMKQQLEIDQKSEPQSQKESSKTIDQSLNIKEIEEQAEKMEKMLSWNMQLVEENNTLKQSNQELEDELGLIASHLSEIGFHEDLQNKNQDNKKQGQNSVEELTLNDKSKEAIGDNDDAKNKRKELSLKPSKKIKILIEATKKLKLAFDDVVYQKMEFENNLKESNHQIKTLEMMIEELKTTNKNFHQEIINLTKKKENGVLSPEQLEKILSSKHMNYGIDITEYSKFYKKRGKNRKSEDEERLTDLLAENKIHNRSHDTEDDYKGKPYYTYNNEEDLIQDGQINEDFDEDVRFGVNSSGMNTTDWGIGVVPEVGRASLETTERHRTSKNDPEHENTRDVRDSSNNNSHGNELNGNSILGRNNGFNSSIMSRNKMSEIRMTETSLDANLKENMEVFIDFTKKVSHRSYSSNDSPNKFMNFPPIEENSELNLERNFKKKSFNETLENAKEEADLVAEGRSSWNKFRTVTEEKLRIMQNKRNQIVKMLMSSINYAAKVQKNPKEFQRDSQYMLNVETVKFVNSTFREFEETNKSLISELKSKNKKISELENQLDTAMFRNSHKEEEVLKPELEPENKEDFNTPTSNKERTSLDNYNTNSSYKRQKNYIQTLEIERLEIENRWKKERIKVRELKRELKMLYNKRGQELKKDLEREKMEMTMYTSSKFSQSNDGATGQIIARSDLMKFSCSSPPSDQSPHQAYGYANNPPNRSQNYLTPPSKFIPENNYQDGQELALQSEGKGKIPSDNEARLSREQRNSETAVNQTQSGTEVNQASRGNEEPKSQKVIDELQRALKNQEKEITFLKSQNLRAREEIDRLLNDEYIDEEEEWDDAQYDEEEDERLTQMKDNSKGADYNKLQGLVQQDLDNKMYFSEN